MKSRTVLINSWIVLVLLVLGLATSAEASQVRMVSYGTQENLNQIATLFMQDHPEIELVIETYPYSEYPTKIVTMIIGNAAPDIIQTWAQYKPDWIEAGFLRDLTAFWDERAELASTLFPFVLEAARYDGRYYGIPHDFNAEAWILQNDLFDSAGIPIPYDDWTVTDLRDYAKKLTDPRGRWLGTGNPVAFGWMSSWQWSRNWTGQGWLSDDRQSVTVDSPEQIDMISFFYDMVHVDEVMNGGLLTAARDAMTGGFAMWQGWADYSFQIARSGAYDFRLATMPRASHGNKSFAQGHMWSIPINANQPDAALVVLDWLLSPKGQEAMVAVGNRQPLSPDRELWDIYFWELPSPLREQVQHYVLNTLYGQNLVDTMSYWNTWPRVNDIMVRHLDEAFNQQQSPANAMHRAAHEIRAVIGENRN